MTTFFTADLHFCHEGILKSAARPFGSVDEMDRAMIASWNSVVTNRDEIFVVGDFAYRGGAERHQRIFDKLAGRKNLVQGNHDHKHLPRGWASISEIKILQLDGDKIVLAHYPMREWPGFHTGAYHLFGHTHSRVPGSARCLDVGVDNIGFTPQSWPQIKTRMALMPDLQYVEGQLFVPRSDVVEEETGDEDGRSFRP